MTRRGNGARAGSACVALAVLAVLGGGAPAPAAGAPRGVHVAFGADPRTEATIVWFTDGADDPGTVVEYGLDDTLGSSASGVSQKVPGQGYPAGTVLAHEVSLTGLPAGATVQYRAGSPSGWSPVRSFTLAPEEGDSFTFTASGDHDTNANAVRTTEAITAAGGAFHLIAGDLSYAQPGTPTFPEWPKWDTWFDQIEPLAASVPLMPAVGNHECESVGCTQSYRARFALPDQEVFYSFDYLNAHFLVWLSDRNALVQERWLADALAFAETDLADAASRKRAGEIDWIIVMQHHPLYGAQIGDLPTDELLERRYNPALIALQERMLLANDVDLLLVGHNHHYQRSKPMILGVPTSNETATYTDPIGYVEVITGGAGRGLAGFVSPMPPWSAANARRYQYVEFAIDGKTLTARSMATDGALPAIIDAFTITQT